MESVQSRAAVVSSPDHWRCDLGTRLGQLLTRAAWRGNSPAFYSSVSGCGIIDQVEIRA